MKVSGVFPARFDFQREDQSENTSFDVIDHVSTNTCHPCTFLEDIRNSHILTGQTMYGKVVGVKCCKNPDFFPK